MSTNKIQKKSKTKNKKWFLTPSQTLYIVDKLRKDIENKKAKSQENLKKLIIFYANEFCNIQGQGRRITKIPKSTLYDFLGKYNFETPMKTSKCKIY